ncbi:uncharacterized protein LOC115923228 [Strongylocentrotus purpuratus]|uniref:Uncharacterized protein n=1 Tax=Strongylocentrotus purpuratus TaxID=7668 RepID=A0A7M7NRB8_STRPU|nr:uncharacterized protein LOC115923228 [Strongylocentrotus purpuratus]
MESLRMGNVMMFVPEIALNHVGAKIESLSTKVIIYISIGIVSGLLLIIAIIVVVVICKRHRRGSNIALRQSVSDREGQELDPYTSLDATSMKQPAYEDIKATRHGNRGHTNTIEGVEYENQTIVEHPYTSLDATTMEQPAYDDTIATTRGDRGQMNAIEGVEYGNQRIVEQTARVKKSNLRVADENTEPNYEFLN